MDIEIDNRLYNDFSIWAEANGMDEKEMHRYIIKAFRDKFMIDKYGDLNDKVEKKEEVKEKPVEKKKVAKKTVKKEEQTEIEEEPKKDETINERPKRKIIQSK